MQAVLLEKVTASDGREVTYTYENIADPVLSADSVVLKEAHFPDGTQSSYSYTRLHPGTLPLLTSSIDPTLNGVGARIEYRYLLDGPLGYIQSEANAFTGDEIVNLASAAAHQVHVTYANGQVRRYQYGQNGNINRFTNGLGHTFQMGFAGGTNPAWDPDY